MAFPDFSTKTRALVCAGASACLLVLLSAGAAAQTTDRSQVEQVLRGLNRGRGVGQIAVSPDGKQLAWIEGGRGGGQIVVAPTDNLKKTQRVTASTKSDQHCTENDLAWEPDSKALAFFSDCAA